MFWPAEWIAAGVALATTTVGAIIALLLGSYGVQAPYLVFLLSVVVALAWGGRTAGVCAAVFASLLTWFFFMPPVWSFRLPSVPDAFTVGLVLAVALLVTLMWGRQRRLIDELTDATIDLRAKLKKASRGERG
jgi:K+-sensing histidine kinase KdpD